MHLVLEVSPAIRKLLLAKGFVYVGWKRCSVVDHLNIMHCRKCCSFGHLEKNCASNSTATFLMRFLKDQCSLKTSEKEQSGN
ncbi:unnamed protein product [Acanthoscelides obtectus]|uniref:CCHC-type domain-containing protein n=1 Tax=Acanthoscelides obtectus TaxID=200917 RepID=A0A9P0QF08_ACAOB|nr:unnamed protein product [Acanthoscelides obtectus]CAK1688540.1 hypothetical protein AOBTE_LOCUS36750 [Acanthoscelides obtectus]